MPSPTRTILFAGGGSGGHLSPGVAIAERLVERDPTCAALFGCSHRAIDAAMLTDAGVRFEPLAAEPLSMRPKGAMRFVRGFRRARRDAAALMRRESVSAVAALGGFVAAPVVAAARSLGRPVVLVNLDARPGRANRWMARRVQRVLTAVPVPTECGLDAEVVGMPIRRITIAPADPATCRVELGLAPDRPTLLVTGASQGAISINALLTAMAERRPTALAGWQIVHLAGAGADEAVRAAYAGAGVDAAVLPRLDRMGLAWGAAELAVSRAGASSVAEAAANAVPTLFMPYPHHRDQHQLHNARPLVDLGGAEIVEDLVSVDANLEHAAPVLLELLADAERRESMRLRLRSQPPGDAAARIADLLLGGL